VPTLRRRVVLCACALSLLLVSASFIVLVTTSKIGIHAGLTSVDAADAHSKPQTRFAQHSGSLANHVLENEVGCNFVKRLRLPEQKKINDLTVEECANALMSDDWLADEIPVLVATNSPAI
jgi:hypothetical protein